MKNIIIGTAGHVDHGKSTLIKALTGIEPDRLKEEQERGMSIELGFASFDLPGGARAGIVDVPGHERFIKNMLMGATGMDMVVLVVAADEGVMPQTREHFAILRLLEVNTGVIALTKADLVDEEWLELAEDDIRELTRGSFLEGAPIIPVSAATGRGMPDLIRALDEIASKTAERLGAGPFRMPIDRIFSIPGFGTVVTGTLRSGVVRVGEAAELLPQQQQTRVRQIQVHGRREESARAGSRVALNLAGIELADAHRGDVVVAAGSLKPTSMVDVRLDLLPELEKPLPHRARIRFHTGAVEIMGRISLLDRIEAAPGESVLAQIRLEQPTAVGRQDRFVIRRYSPGVLVGGGVILDAGPARHRRNQENVISSLLVLERGTTDEMVEQTFLKAGPNALTADEAAATAGLEQSEVAVALKALAVAEPPRVIPIGTRWVHAHHLSELETRVTEILDEFHRRQPLQPGMPREEVRARSGRSVDSRVYNRCLTHLEETGVIVSDGHLLRRSTHEIRLEGRQEEIAAIIRERYRSAALNPPSVDDALSSFGPQDRAREVFEVLVVRRDLVKLTEGLYLSGEVARETTDTAVRLLKEHGTLTVSELRDEVGSSRKVMVPFLEYLDSRRVTRRRGDERVLY